MVISVKRPQLQKYINICFWIIFVSFQELEKVQQNRRPREEFAGLVFLGWGDVIHIHLELDWKAQTVIQMFDD
jgi:hypothetical protein